VLGVANGNAGGARRGSGRLSRGEHAALDLGLADVVAMSSRVESRKRAGRDARRHDLCDAGIELRTWWSEPAVHVSGMRTATNSVA